MSLCQSSGGDNMVLTDKHYKSIDLLLAGESQSSTAKKVGVSRQAVSRWLQDEDFLLEMEKMREDIRNDTVNSLTSAGKTAVNKLIYLMNESESQQIQYNAAVKILEYTAGKPTTRIEQSIETKENSIDNIKDIDSMLNVIPIKTGNE